MIRTVLVLYWAAILLGLTVLVTQILWPLWKGIPLFPWVRNRQVDVELTRARGEEELDQRREELDKIAVGRRRRNIREV